MKDALVIPGFLKHDSGRSVVIVEKDRFDINFFSRLVGYERTSLKYKHFELSSQHYNKHTGCEGLKYLFTHCKSIKIERQ